MDVQAATERAKEALAVLDSGANEWASSGYGYEHMGDMARDLRPLAEDVLALAAALQQAERECDELRANARHTADVVNERLDATFAAEDEAIHAWRSRAIAAKARLAEAERERDELARTLALAVADFRESEARLAEARKALQRIADADYRGNPSWESGIARAALAATEGDTTEPNPT
jgi:DNA repair exonuclease SbcCD ATPase subunit